VLVSKSCERKTARGDPFCVWRLSDLNCVSQASVTLMLFRDAQQAHAAVPLGSVLLLLGTSPMEDRDPGGGSSSSRISSSNSSCDGLKVSVRCAEPWQVVRLGEAIDFGVCKGTRKDGLGCSVPVNKALCGGCKLRWQITWNPPPNNRCFIYLC
jgi:minichromosome maintenance protein 10